LAVIERQERHDARPFDSDGQFALVPRANTGPFFGQDFQIRIDEFPQERGIFVINFIDVVRTEKTSFDFFDWTVVNHNFLGAVGRPLVRRATLLLVIRLKRDIFHLDFFFGRIVSRAAGIALHVNYRFLAGQGRLFVFSGTLAGTRSVQHDQIFRDNFRAVALAPVRPDPIPGLEPALHKDFRAAAQILAGDFTQAPPSDAIMIFRFFLLLAGLILPDVIRGHGKGSDIDARRGGSHFRIAGQIADDHGFVEIHNFWPEKEAVFPDVNN